MLQQAAHSLLSYLIAIPCAPLPLLPSQGGTIQVDVVSRRLSADPVILNKRRKEKENKTGIKLNNIKS